jgi:site-specific DNA recombinase
VKFGGKAGLDFLRVTLKQRSPAQGRAEGACVIGPEPSATVTPQAVEVRLISSGSTSLTEPSGGEPAPSKPAASALTLPWAAPSFEAVKGIVHEPAVKCTMKPESRDALLAAIAKAREWIEDLRLGRVATLSEIAEREALGERHVRLLAPLAFVSPVVMAAVADGDAPADLTVTGLAKAVAHSWAKQQRCFAAETSPVGRSKHGSPSRSTTKTPLSTRTSTETE